MFARLATRAPASAIDRVSLSHSVARLPSTQWQRP